jgi:hypothetical protein
MHDGAAVIKYDGKRGVVSRIKYHDAGGAGGGRGAALARAGADDLRLPPRHGPPSRRGTWDAGCRCSPTKGTPFDVARYSVTFRLALTAAGITDYVRPFHDLRH